LLDLPFELSRLPALEAFSFSHNPMKYPPVVLRNLTHLQTVNAGSDKAWEIPKEEVDKGSKGLIDYFNSFAHFKIKFHQKAHWVADHDSPKCMICSSVFTTFNRRVCIC